MPIGALFSFPIPPTIVTQLVNVEASLVDAVNVALEELGDEPIASLDDDSARARKAKTKALPCLDARLEEHDWNFARRRATLVAETAPPVYEYPFAFPLPTDPFCLKVRSTSLDHVEQYSIEQNAAGQRVLLAQTSAVSIVYTARVYNPALWSALFAEWYSARLAHELCQGITGKADYAKLLWDKAEAIGRKAKARDGQEGRRGGRIASDVLTRVRP